MRAAETKFTSRQGKDVSQARNRPLRRSGVTANRANAWQWAALLGGGALLGFGLTRRNNRAGLATSVAGSALLYRGVTMAQPGGGLFPGLSPGMETQRTVTILRSASELYRFWKDPANFPRFMEHVESVSQVNPKTQHWVVSGPMDRKVEWDAEITADLHDRMIAWSTRPGSLVEQSGVIEFHPVRLSVGDGTEVRLTMNYRVPAGALGSGIALLFGREPSQTVRENLRRFKQLIESGEIATIIGQPHGERGISGRIMETALGERPKARLRKKQEFERERVVA